MNEPTSIKIDDVEYVRKDSLPSVPVVDGEHVLIRSRDSGVHVGILNGRDGDEVILSNARRIWYWAGAATVSELAIKGTSKPKDCKFPAPVPEITVLGVCEVIPMTAEAVESVYSVPVWSQS